MIKIELKTVVFDGNAPRKATTEFDVQDQSVECKMKMAFVLSTRVGGEYTGAYEQTLDDAEVVQRARRHLHEFATRLAEQTKDWAAPASAEAPPP